jgi:hypothetical protein
VERDEIDEARILTAIPERLSDVGEGLQEIFAKNLGLAEDESLGVVDEGEHEMRAGGEANREECLKH